MTQIDSKSTQKRKPTVSKACIGCGACVAISGDVFSMDNEGYSIVKDLLDYEGYSVNDSIAACPVNAIRWN